MEFVFTKISSSSIDRSSVDGKIKLFDLGSERHSKKSKISDKSKNIQIRFPRFGALFTQHVFICDYEIECDIQNWVYGYRASNLNAYKIASPFNEKALSFIQTIYTLEAFFEFIFILLANAGYVTKHRSERICQTVLVIFFWAPFHFLLILLYWSLTMYVLVQIRFIQLFLFWLLSF